jgi:hypothetical protein
MSESPRPALGELARTLREAINAARIEGNVRLGGLPVGSPAWDRHDARVKAWDDALSALVALATGGATADAVDAERWRAFLGSQRIRFFGTAGPHDGYVHFGGEFWTLHTDVDSEATRRNREFLTLYADTARAARSLTPERPADAR